MKRHLAIRVILFTMIFSITFLGIINIHGRIKENSLEKEKNLDKDYVEKLAFQINSTSFNSIINTLESLEKQKILQSHIESGNRDRINDLIYSLSAIHHDSIIYIMDLEGNVIASTPYNDEGDTFLGKNYSFRPYFQNALTHDRVIYPAVGVTSGERGIYFSKSLSLDSRLQGVIVIKYNPLILEDMLSNDRSLLISFITNHGVVFLSNEKNILMKTDHKLTDSEIVEISKNKQFPLDKLFPLGEWNENEKVIIDDTLYNSFYLNIDDVGWRVLSLKQADAYSIHREDTSFFIQIIALILFLFFILILLEMRIGKVRKAERKAKKFQFIIDQSPISILITDVEGNIDYANKNFFKTTGYSREETVGMNCSALRSDYHDREYYSSIRNTIEEGGIWSGELYNKRKDDSLFWEDVKIYPLMERKGEMNQFISIKEDITEKKAFMTQLEKDASIDEMTSAYNRKNGLRQGQNLFIQAQKTHTPLTVSYIDINNLKIVNDKQGHDAGDKLITTVSSILKSTIRGSDILTRLGGDEFLIIYRDMSREASEKVWERIQEKFAQKSTPEVPISVSYGSVEYDRARHDYLDDLIKEADEKMYANKREFKMNFCNETTSTA
ncbi:MAG: diguanylate cyclase [Spirochaetales bacterium]|nr:diguanylate cyclase [Spirochaetales bacterium]